LTPKYEDWLERQNELIKEALELVQSVKFRAVIIKEERKPSFIRIYLDDKPITFHIKEVKSKFVKSVWLGKKANFKPQHNYLIFAAKEKTWMVTTGRQALAHGEYKDSTYHKDTKVLVVPMDVFRPAKSFLRTIKKRHEQRKQRRMSDWL